MLEQENSTEVTSRLLSCYMNIGVRLTKTNDAGANADDW